MKKLFTLVAIALLGGAVSVNAQTTHRQQIGISLIGKKQH